MTVVLPIGTLYRKNAEGRIRSSLLKQNILEAVIGLGNNIFYGTPVPVCLMVFNNQKETEKKDKVLFIDASEQVRVGRAQSYLEPEHITQIFEWYKNYEDVENYVKVASKTDLEENNYNLNIPLYIDKTIEDNLPPVEEALTDLKDALGESLKAEDKFKSILNEYL